jgi:hypothetical protein
MTTVLKDFCKAYEILPLNTPILLNFKMDGILRFYETKEYTVSLNCSNRSVSLSTKKIIVYEGMKFNTSIQSTTACSVLLEISVDGVINARLSFKFIDSEDVFNKDRYDLMMIELKYVVRQVHPNQPGLSDPPRREYRHSSGYCMGTAERGLSELLGDITNFYAVERNNTDDHKNKINFSGLTAKERGRHFQKIGYTASYYNFNEYKIINSKKNQIFNAKDNDDAYEQYKNVEYDIIEFNASGKNKLNEIFERDLKAKELGYHIYYFTVTDGYHTLLLIIDTITDPCNPTYVIWDQDGPSDYNGLLSDIAEGIRRQTSWTFAHSCRLRYEHKKTEHVDYTNTFLWKIKRKK